MSPGRRLRVLVAEDSVTARELLVQLLTSDPGIDVVGQAGTGAEAVELALAIRPDLITMDIHMPVMAGLEATKEIMARIPTPIIIVTSSASRQAATDSFDALRAGALMILPKPTDPASAAFNGQRERLLTMVKAMADVKVVGRRGGDRAASRRGGRSATGPLAGAPRRSGIVAIASSTGGPAALQRILMALPRDFPLPILVTQHIAPGFVQPLADWLGSTCDLHVRVAAQGEALAPRTVFLAPDACHLGVDEGGRIALSTDPPLGGHRPSCTHLFRSVARHYGASVTALMLTGMGADGVEGLREVRQAGGRILAQDAESSVVFGMPRAAIDAGLADLVQSPELLANTLTTIVRELSL